MEGEKCGIVLTNINRKATIALQQWASRCLQFRELSLEVLDDTGFTRHGSS
jgi:hypothetical protein